MKDVKLNGMRELNFNEIEEVSGGFYWQPFVFTFSVFNYWRRSQPVGQGSDNPPRRFDDATHINDFGSTFV